MSLLSRLVTLTIFAAGFATLFSLGDFSHRYDSTPGCGIAHDFGGVKREFSIYSNNKIREFYVHLPQNYHPDVPTPIIIAYHGNGGSPESMEHVTQLSDPLVNPNMITVYPRGIDLYWMGANYTDPDVDDMVFTGDLIERLMQDYCIDPTRLYATGHSAGGGFVSQLACTEYPGRLFAAFAPMAPVVYTDLVDEENCEFSTRRRPMFVVAGTGDKVAPYEGGMGHGGILPSLRGWVERWLQRNHCLEEPQVTYLPNDVRDESFTCDGRPGLMRQLIMEGHGHAYPDKGHLKEKPSPVDATTLAVQFFEQHSGD